MYLKYKIQNFGRKIKLFFFPQNQWLRKSVPREFRDLDILWENAIINGLIFYVEQDYGLGYEPGDYEHSQNSPTYPEHQKELDREVKKYYELAKYKLPELENQLKIAWDNVPPVNIDDLIKNPHRDKKSYEDTYGEVDRLEAKIEKLQTDIMIFCVRRRKSLWT